MPVAPGSAKWLARPLCPVMPDNPPSETTLWPDGEYATAAAPPPPPDAWPLVGLVPSTLGAASVTWPAPSATGRSKWTK